MGLFMEDSFENNNNNLKERLQVTGRHLHEKPFLAQSFRRQGKRPIITVVDYYRPNAFPIRPRLSGSAKLANTRDELGEMPITHSMSLN